ncbi:MAG: ribosome-associated translation inhibitor RaiA [Ruminiclostridium sp.]|nr:ribosome-associated translation inhibitor RaiA [Ruminiclostridium sp.]
MRIIISGKNIEVTDALKEKINKKLGKLDKYFGSNTEANVTMSVEKNRHIFEVTVHLNGIVLRAEVENNDMYACVDKAVDILEGQIRKNKTRLGKKLHAAAFKTDDFKYDAQVEEERDFQVVRTKRFAIKPMTIEEAILQMNLLGHQFFMFSNAKSKEVNVVYRRKDGNYGLIEPEFT